MPPKRARAKAPPKARKPAARAPRKVAAPKGVKFRSRGPHKCTINAEGKSCKGMHKALAEAIGTGFDYDAAKKAGTLKTVPIPKADVFIPIGNTKNTRKLAYSAQQGIRVDRQVGAVVKLMLMPTIKVPVRAFLEKSYMDHYVKLKFGTRPTSLEVIKKIRKIRSAANTLLPETEQLLRYMHTQKLTPVGTQVPVASGKVGTQVDLVLAVETGEHIVCELKAGCDTNFHHSKTMPAPFEGFLYTTHREHQLQTIMTSRLYTKTFPARKVKPPRLIRIDRAGLHVYLPPQWALDSEQQLAQRMGC